ncbi:MAG: hypothetical protein EBV03_04320 [Proteobacteria bacterium]|nr:hypothetical protein [Pseudomonadota bacterium]
MAEKQIEMAQLKILLQNTLDARQADIQAARDLDSPDSPRKLKPQGNTIEHISLTPDSTHYIIDANGGLSRSALQVLGLEGKYERMKVEDENGRRYAVDKQALDEVLGVKMVMDRDMVLLRDKQAAAWAAGARKSNPAAVRDQRKNISGNPLIVQEALATIFPEEHSGVSFKVEFIPGPPGRSGSYDVNMYRKLPREDFAKAVGMPLAPGMDINEDLPSRGDGRFRKIVTIAQDRLEAALAQTHNIQFPQRELS